MLPSRSRACTPTTSSSSSHRSRTAHLRRPPEGRIQPQAGQICRRRAGSRRLAGYCDMQQPPVLWGPVCSVSAPPPPEHCGRARSSRDWSSPAPRLRRPRARAGARSQRRPPHMNQASDLVDAAIFFHGPPRLALSFAAAAASSNLPHRCATLRPYLPPPCLAAPLPMPTPSADEPGSTSCRCRWEGPAEEMGNLATAMVLAWMCIWIPFCYCVRGREG